MRRSSDKIDSVLSDIFKIRNPHITRPATQKELSVLLEKINDNSNLKKFGLPISKKAYLELVSSRNKNLIYPHEQKKLRESNVVFFGMSVGASALLSWMMLSRAERVTIIDPDTIDITNLNRLLFGVKDIGRLKVDALKEFIVKINPFTNTVAYAEKGNKVIDKAVGLVSNINVVIDEMDDIEAKIYLRKVAKAKKIPLISAADVGDMTMIDIERYDIDQSTIPFMGLLGNIEEIDFHLMSEFEKKKMIIKLVGFENNSERLLDSLMAIGGTVNTWPQLGPTAFMTGGIVALVIKKIILGEKIKSGRYYVSLDNMLVEDFNSAERISVRSKKIENIKKLLKL